MLTGVQAVEGCDQSWIESVHQDFDTFFPESLSTQDSAMEAMVRKFMDSEHADNGAWSWATALARQVWMDLRPTDSEGQRAPFPRLRRTQLFGMDTPPPKHANENERIERLEKMVESLVMSTADKDERARLERPREQSHIADALMSRRENTELKNMLAGLDREAEAPAARLTELLRGYQDEADWPWTEQKFCTRLAKVQLTKMLRTSRCKEYWELYIQKKQLQGNKSAEEGLRWAFLLDTLIFHDRLTLQSRAVEVAARRLYALEKVFESVWERKEWENQDNRSFAARYGEIEDYDLFYAGAEWSADADDAVAKDRESRAKRAKWLPAPLRPGK